MFAACPKTRTCPKSPHPEIAETLRNALAQERDSLDSKGYDCGLADFRHTNRAYKAWLGRCLKRVHVCLAHGVAIGVLCVSGSAGVVGKAGELVFFSWRQR